MTHAAPEFAPKPAAALTRCEACGNTDTCVRPTARDMPAIKRRLGRGVEPDTRWLCPDCDGHRKRAHALSAALRCALHPHPATVEAAVVDAALRGMAIDPDAVPPTMREGLLWTLTGRDLWRLDECGQLADVDDRPGPPRPALLRPAHPWTVAPVADRWGMALAEYKIGAAEWQRWGPPDEEITKKRIGWPSAENKGDRWPRDLDPPLLVGVGYTTVEREPEADGFLDRRIGYGVREWGWIASGYDQADLWRALADRGFPDITPPCRRVAVTNG